MSLQALLDDVDAMNKSLTANADPDPDVDPDADPDDGEGEGEGDAPLGKSFSVTMPDGTVREAFDGEEMLKSLGTEVEALQKHSEQSDKVLGEAIGLIKSMHGTIKSQESTMKSMREEIARLGRSGTGRKAMLSVHDRPSTTPAPEAPKGMPYGDVMSKALTLQREGKLSAMQVCRLEAHVNRGHGIPEDIAPLLGA